MKDVFFPYYVNRGRLFDIYSVLNYGYAEYEEITQTDTIAKQKNDKGQVSIEAGFKLFKFGGTAGDEKTQKDEKGQQHTIKRVQTIASMLRLVIDEMREQKLLQDISSAKEGDFIELENISFQLNSLKTLIGEIDEVVKIIDLMPNNGLDATTKKSVKDYANISKAIKTLGNGEEAVYESNDFALVGTIFDECLYQSVKSDLICSPFSCLVQIKRIYPEGTTLMKNTIFNHIRDQKMKKTFIDAINALLKSKEMSFDSSVISEITGKKVYQIEIIAMYK